MMSSAGRPSDEALLRRLDVSRLLVKPVKQSDLLNAITNALGVSMREDEGEGPASAAHLRTSPGLTVLLAEDGAVNRQVAVDLLTKRGHRVVAVGNGQEAIEAVERGSYDLVLMLAQTTDCRKPRDREKIAIAKKLSAGCWRGL